MKAIGLDGLVVSDLDCTAAVQKWATANLTILIFGHLRPINEKGS